MILGACCYLSGGKELAVMDALINLQFLVDDAKCFDTVWCLRRPEGVGRAWCGSAQR